MIPKTIILWAAMLFVAGSAVGQTVDTTFRPGAGVQGGIGETAIQQFDGKILVCGNFTAFNGQPRGYIARLNPDGSVDPTFRAFPSYWVRHMSLQADGKIIIGGFFTSVGGVSRRGVARLNQDGSLDLSFNPGAGAYGSLGTSITGDTNSFVFSTALQGDGKVLITGNFTVVDGVSRRGLARLHPNGDVDHSFAIGSGMNSWGRSVMVQPNGQVLATGWFTEFNGQGANRMVRLNANGTTDTSFNPFFGDRTAIYSAALQPDGKIVVGGHSLNLEGLFLSHMARLNPNGSFDTSFQASADEKVQSVRVLPNGKILIGGGFGAVNGVQRRNLARLNPNGTLDETFVADTDNFVWSVALQGDGKILAAGGFNSVNGISRPGVLRLTASGTSTPPPTTRPPLVLGGDSQIIGTGRANTDGNIDILTSKNNSTLAAHMMSGLRSVAETDFAATPSAATAIDAGDFNGDGLADVVAVAGDGSIVVWLRSGAQFSVQRSLGQLPAGWRLAGVARLSPGPKNDLIVQHDDGRVSVWFFNGTTRAGGRALQPARNALWRMVGSGDVNGDGQDDLVWQAPTGQIQAWLMYQSTVAGRKAIRTTAAASGAWMAQTVGDLNRDGHADLVMRHGDGRVAAWFLRGGSIIQRAQLTR